MADCCYAECHLCEVSPILSGRTHVIYAECDYAECHYVECLYAEHCGSLLLACTRNRT
jgi:hypothetical protein